jgi:hypothetical protein
MRYYHALVSVASYQATIQSMKKQIESNNATSTATADIDLVKNLFVGYITAPNAIAKNQILKLISNVLNLSDAECVRIGLKNDAGGASGWFSRTASDNLNNNVSLTEAFVTFLEKESQPRVNAANLLTIHEKETTTAVRKSSASGIVRESDEEAMSSAADSSNTNTESPPAPILLGENTLLTSYNNRNSSSILKDILHDS